MRKRADLTGMRFGMLMVLREATEDPRYGHWIVRCDCGVEKAVYAYALLKGLTVSCSCQRGKVMAQKRIIHGASGTPTHKSWRSMLSRCRATRGRWFELYGSRGITICERWLSFSNFLADMGDRRPGTSIDRIDNDKGYEPGNCRWATTAEQARNKRRSIFLEYNGKKQNLADWAKELGIRYNVMHSRWQKSQDPVRVLRPLEVCTRWRR